MRAGAVILVVIGVLSAYAAISPPPKVRIRGPDNVPLEGALVVAERLDGTRVEFRLDPESPTLIRDVPLGVLRITVVEWKSVPVNCSALVTPQNTTVICSKIHRVLIRALGARGQGLGEARVEIAYGQRIVERGLTDGSGTYRTYLPEAVYSVKVSYGAASRAVEIAVDSDKEVEVPLDILLGRPLYLSPGDFLGMLLLMVALVLAIFVVAFEYRTWRRRRIVRPVVGGGSSRE